MRKIILLIMLLISVNCNAVEFNHYAHTSSAITNILINKETFIMGVFEYKEETFMKQVQETPEGEIIVSCFVRFTNQERENLLSRVENVKKDDENSYSFSGKIGKKYIYVKHIDELTGASTEQFKISYEQGLISDIPNYFINVLNSPMGSKND